LPAANYTVDTELELLGRWATHTLNRHRSLVPGRLECNVQVLRRSADICEDRDDITLLESQAMVVCRENLRVLGRPVSRIGKESP
jgi:hypothetical protein